MKVSIVCPFYNENAIIENAARNMTKNLRKSGLDWEFIAVNDGSTDDSLELIEKIFKEEPKRTKIISYSYNQGRGYALKRGIDDATGDLIITTEIDLSWGETVIQDIVDKFIREPFLDAVVASPNLPGGGYKNVPLKRVLVSRFGNKILRMLFTSKVTMNTGMTRGYKREIIQSLRIDEKGKEFHLEVLLKLFMLGYRIGEIPAVLEWKDHKLFKTGSKKRKSSSNVPQLILSHLNFAVFANPIRYFWGFSAGCLLLSIAFVIDATYRLYTGEVAIFVALVGMFLGIFSLLFFGFGIVTTQNIKVLKELWKKNNNPSQ